MYLVLSIASEVYAESISSALWSISIPPSIKSGHHTILYTSWVVHPLDASVALYVPDETQPVHTDADIDSLMSVITAAITTDESNAIRTAIGSRKGSTISFLEILQASPSLAPNLKTREQMETDGWFSS